MAKIKPGRQRFNTSVEVGTAYNVNTNDGESVDGEINTYLGDRRKRLLDEAKLAELEHATEDEKTEAERARRERELLQSGKISPTTGSKEGDMGNTEKRVQDAAEVAAEAASAGVNPEDATDLGTGKSKVVVIKPPETGSGDAPVEGKGWSVVDGKPVKDPDGEYSFSRALKVAAMEKAKGSNDPLAVFKWMKEEGLLAGSKGDDFMSKFTSELAQRSVESVVARPDSGNNSAIEALRAEMTSLRQELRNATDPVASARRVKEVFDGFKTLNLIPEPSTGETSINDLKVKYDHEEKMEAIKADREHKGRMADIADDMSERVGQGIGQEIRHGRGAGVKPSGSNLPTVHCSDCNIDFTVAPEAKEAICPKCGAAYIRGDSVPPNE